MDAGPDTKIAQPTIGEVLTEFITEQGERLSAKTFARYQEMIELLTCSLNNYAYQRLSQADAELLNRLYDSQGDQHREFCAIFGPDQIVPNLGEFLGYFMIRKVIAGPELMRAAGTVTEVLARWLGHKGYLPRGAATEGAAEAAQAARVHPAGKVRLSFEGIRGTPEIEPRKCRGCD